MRDAMNKGRVRPFQDRTGKSWQNPGNARLDAGQVYAIRQAYLEGSAVRELASRYSVTVTNIYAILSGRSWSHVAFPVGTRTRPCSRDEFTKRAKESRGAERIKARDARQERILRAIVSFASEHGYPPTIREIQTAIGGSSTSVVNYWLNSLQADGLIERDPAVARGIRVLELAA